MSSASSTPSAPSAPSAPSSTPLFTPPPRRAGSLRRQLTLMAGLVALASVLVTGVATIGLFRQGATSAARTALGHDADTVASTIEGLSNRTVRRQRIGTATLNRQLAKRQIVLGTTDSSDPSSASLPAPFTMQDVTTTIGSGSVSRTTSLSGQTWLIEGRLAGTTAALLAQPQDRAVAESAAPRRRLFIPLVLGLAVGALASWVMARQLARPLSRLRSAAQRLSGGDREVRIPTDGPAEIADVATALNHLAEALAGSEARQRRFLMDVSHELRTPLTAVAGYAEGLADGELTGPEVRPAAEVIRTEAARLSRRVDDLLALARMEADDFRIELAPADLVQLVRAAAQAWAPRAAAVGVRLEVQVPQVPIVVTTDAERLRQAVDALADNALRVLAPGARLVLGAGTDSTDSTDSAGSAGSTSPTRTWVSVSDDGPGLSPDDLAVAFERGRLTERYRGDRPVGSGLGLALVGELARRMGGEAVAASPPGGPGVTFAIVLPAR